MTQLHPVYVVDDDPDVREALYMELTGLGIATRIFANGVDFIAASDNLPAGCVILDMAMPGDGLGVLRHIETCPDRFRAIIISGTQDAPKAALALDLGAVGWLEKPFTEAALIGAVAEACAKLASMQR